MLNVVARFRRGLGEIQNVVILLKLKRFLIRNLAMNWAYVRFVSDEEK